MDIAVYYMLKATLNCGNKLPPADGEERTDVLRRRRGGVLSFPGACLGLEQNQRRCASQPLRAVC